MRGTLADCSNGSDDNNDCQRRFSPFIDTAATAYSVCIIIYHRMQCSTLNYEHFLFNVIVFQNAFYIHPISSIVVYYITLLRIVTYV